MKISKADLVLVNGLQFEGFLQRLVEVSATNALVIKLTKGVEPIKMKEEHEHATEAGGNHHNHTDLDPHAFQSIDNAKIYMKNIADAFGYFENAYGITFLAPESISTEAEALAADVAALISHVRGDKAPAIFIENITNPRPVEQISVETGVKVRGTFYSDALSKADSPTATYINMMKSNIATIKGAILSN